MTIVRYIKNPNSLARKIAAPGGKKVSAAVADAETELSEMTPAGLEAIDACIAIIAASVVRTSETPPSAETLEAVYQAASAVHGSAAVFGLRDLGEAAWSLCELIDTGGGALRSGMAAISSHLDSLRLLRLGEALTPEQRRELLDGLQDLRLHTKQEAAAG